MKNSCVMWLSIIAVVLIMTTTTMFIWYKAVQPEPSISAAQHKVEQIYDGNAAAIRMLNHTETNPNVRFRTKLNPKDLKQFNSHLYNLAAERRWLMNSRRTHKQRWHTIIMRDQDISIMRQVANNPHQWAQDEMTKEFKHHPPIHEGQMITASLFISTHHRSEALIIAGSILTMPSIVATSLSIISAIGAWRNRKNNRKVNCQRESSTQKPLEPKPRYSATQNVK